MMALTKVAVNAMNTDRASPLNPKLSPNGRAKRIETGVFENTPNKANAAQTNAATIKRKAVISLSFSCIFPNSGSRHAPKRGTNIPSMSIHPFMLFHLIRFDMIENC